MGEKIASVPSRPVQTPDSLPWLSSAVDLSTAHEEISWGRREQAKRCWAAVAEGLLLGQFDPLPRWLAGRPTRV